MKNVAQAAANAQDAAKRTAQSMQAKASETALSMQAKASETALSMQAKASETASAASSAASAMMRKEIAKEFSICAITLVPITDQTTGKRGVLEIGVSNLAELKSACEHATSRGTCLRSEAPPSSASASCGSL